jgi:CheY-like chemotaxis protein
MRRTRWRCCWKRSATTPLLGYDGIQALAHIEAQKPDCVMLDIAIQGMDGLELTRQIRQKFGDDIVLVAITGAAVDDPRVKETFETVDHYFEKPVTLQQIQKLFPPLIDGRQSKQAWRRSGRTAFAGIDTGCE